MIYNIMHIKNQSPAQLVENLDPDPTRPWCLKYGSWPGPGLAWITWQHYLNSNTPISRAPALIASDSGRSIFSDWSNEIAKRVLLWYGGSSLLITRPGLCPAGSRSDQDTLGPSIQWSLPLLHTSIALNGRRPFAAPRPELQLHKYLTPTRGLRAQ